MRHLKASQRKVWDAVVRAWVLDEDGLAMLELYCTSLARAEEARRLLERDGLLVHDRFGKPKAHPAVAIERDAVRVATSCGKALDLEEPEPPRGALALTPRNQWQRGA